MHFILSTAAHSGQASNTIYPRQLTVTNTKELEQAVHYDHVCGQFKNNQRNITNFIKADAWSWTVITITQMILLSGSNPPILPITLTMLPLLSHCHATT